MIRKLAKKGLRAAKLAVETGAGLVTGQRGVGYGVGEYDEIDRIRHEARAQDEAEGVATLEGEWDAIDDGTQEISAEDLRVMLEVEEGEDLPVIVDVRESHEWATGHIEGALHIPLGQIETRATDIDGDRIVVLYCASGMRSIDGSYVLKRAGFPRVQSLAGGIDAWRQAGHDVAGG